MNNVIDEKELFNQLNKAKSILLIEPPYPRKYPPLGLAKLKTYLESKGKKVVFSRSILPEKFDLICVTTLFTYYSKYVYKVIRNKGFFNNDTPIIVGGIFASIMPKAFSKEKNLFVFKGYSKRLDLCMPDDSIMSDIEKPWSDFSYVFTSRGCVNRCGYCCVWKIEPDRWINPKWKELIDTKKKYIMIYDNNLSSLSFKHLKSLINYLCELDKRVVFDNGFDCKYIDAKIAKELARVKYLPSGMRLAFDRIEEDGVFQKAVTLLIKAGIPKNAMFAYVLFNFNDKPKDAEYRARECLRLGVRPYPQYYRPLNILNKSDIWVGKYWSLNLGRAFRYFWLMRGIYSKMSFEEYLKKPESIKRHKLTEKDIALYR